MKNKKGEMGLIIVLVIIILLFAVGWVINIGNRECNNNNDCGSDSYCGSDFSCHSFPVIEKTKNSLFWPSVIIGLAIIISAAILKLSDFKAKEEPVVEQKKAEEAEDTIPYYESNKNTKLN